MIENASDITSVLFINVGGVVMDLEAHTVFRDKKPIRLSPREFGLLEYLMRHAGVVLSREEILKDVWKADLDYFSNTVDVHIRFLRHKLDGGFKHKLIQTVHGYGYKFDPE